MSGETQEANFWIELAKAIGPILVGLAAVFSTLWLSRRGLKFNKLTAERQEIYKKLNEFYGPFIQYREKSKIFYRQFRQDKPEGFSTLKKLLAGYRFQGNDKVLLDEIISIGQKCENLIHEKSGIIDDDKLTEEVLPKATTHYLILRQAYNHVYNGGGLSGDVENLQHFKFPDDLDSELEKSMKELKRRLREIDEKIDM